MKGRYQRKFDSSEALCAYVRETFGPKQVLGFSGGKDSVACWLQLRRAGIEVIPLYLWYVPGLRLEQEVIGFYEDFFGQRIHRFPHGVFLDRLNDITFLAPWQVKVVDEAKMHRDISNRLIIRELAKLNGLHRALFADGTRESDSLRRRITIRRYGSLFPSSSRFFPVYDWNDNRVEQELRDAKVPLSPEYRLLGRGFECTADQLEGLGREYPDDVERILAWFPLLKADSWRRRFARPTAA